MNGRAIGDSTRIIEEIERRWPDPPLYPADPEERSRALELEDYFDEQCGHDARRVLFNDNLAEPETFLAMFSGADRRRIGVLEPLTPLFCRPVKWRFRIRPETVEESREKVRAAFDRVEADVGPSGYLVGESFTVADLTAASILGLIVVPPEFPYIKVHPDERDRPVSAVPRLAQGPSRVQVGRGHVRAPSRDERRGRDHVSMSNTDLEARMEAFQRCIERRDAKPRRPCSTTTTRSCSFTRLPR